MVGQGTIFFVRRRRLTKKNSGDFIDFKLIQENKLTDRAEMIQSKLKILENMINTIADENVPIEAILETTEKKLQLLLEKKKQVQQT